MTGADGDDHADADAVAATYETLSPPERARVTLEARLAGVLPDEWVREAIDTYDGEDPTEAVWARFAEIDTDETLTVDVEVGIEPALFKRAWLRYELARRCGESGSRAFEDIMFDYIDFRPRFEVVGPLYDVEDLLVEADPDEEETDEC